MIKILLVDDQPLIRRGLSMRLALEPDLLVVAEANDGMQALEVIPEIQPDVVIMDVEMPKMDGVTAAARLHELFPEIPVIILSMHDTTSLKAHARVAGAVAFVEKQSGVTALLQEIRNAANKSTKEMDT